MSARSLRVRLLLGGAVAMLAALGLAWAGMTWLFEAHLRRAVEADLTRIATAVVAELRLEADGRPRVATPPVEPRLGAPASGLYWQVTTPAGSERSRSLWDAALPAPAPETASRGAWSARRADGPYGASLLMLERLIRPDGAGPDVLVQTATNLSAVTRPRDEFARELGLFLLILWALLATASWAQVRLGLAPLSKVRAALAAMRQDPAARLGASDWPNEVAPLAAEIDALAETRQKDLERARLRAGDLAHSLKTPLAALSAEIRRLEASAGAEAVEGFARTKDAIASAIEAELARARVARADRRGAGAELEPVVERLIGVLVRTGDGEAIVFDVDAPKGFTLPIAASDLTEMLGAILENAVRHARRIVRIGVVDSEGWRGVEIEDDGDGLDARGASHALTRGVRLDEAVGGHGLGLTIASDVASATGATLTLAPSVLSGLKVRIVWTADRSSERAAV